MAGPLAVHGCRYYDKSVGEVDSAHQLRALQAEGGDVWLIYTFSETLQVGYPHLWESITDGFSIVERFEGTVGNGAIVVCLEKSARKSKDDQDLGHDAILLETARTPLPHSRIEESTRLPHRVHSRG